MPIVKNSGFFTHKRRGDRKRAIFEIFGAGVLSVGYNLHRTSDLHAKAWIISGDVVDVPFGGNRPPINNGTLMGDHQTPKSFRSKKHCFLWPIRRRKNSLISTVPLFSKSDKKWLRYRKMWFWHRYARENDWLKCHNSRENAASWIAYWQIRQPRYRYSVCHTKYRPTLRVHAKLQVYGIVIQCQSIPVKIFLSPSLKKIVVLGDTENFTSWLHPQFS